MYEIVTNVVCEYDASLQNVNEMSSISHPCMLPKLKHRKFSPNKHTFGIMGVVCGFST